MFNICKTCSVQPTGSGYLVKKDNKDGTFYKDLGEIKAIDYKDQKVSIVSIIKYADVNSIKNQLSNDKKFVDNHFPPSESSLGKFQNVYTDKWRRITQLIQQPKIFGQYISPYDAIQSNSKQTKNFQTALAIMAQNPNLIYTLFNKQYQISNSKGLYTFLLKVNGKIHEITIDDYIPLNQFGQPMFSKPFNSVIWNILLQKARAKSYDSYQNMLKHSDSVRKIIEQFTYAPSRCIKHLELPNKEQLWNMIMQIIKNGLIGYGLTMKSEHIKWNQIGLAQGEYYTIADACYIENILGAKFKVMKLRSHFFHLQFKGQGSLTDTIFWQQLQKNQDKKRMLTIRHEKQRYIYILFSDYCKYFQQTNLHFLQKTYSFHAQPLKYENINGLLYELNILHEGVYTFMVHQNQMKSQNKQTFQYIEDGWCRTSMIIAKLNGIKGGGHQEFQLIDGLLKYNQRQPQLRVKLSAAKYLLFIKIQPTVKQMNFPQKPGLSIYSIAPAQLTLTNQHNYPEFLKKMFLIHARGNKKQSYNNQLMWSAWKLIIQGGYAYIAFGNSALSKKKFVIKFSEELFLKLNFSLKKPYKYKGNQIIQILPGQQQIILLRIKNSLIKQITFPPPIQLQIIDIL